MKLTMLSIIGRMYLAKKFRDFSPLNVNLPVTHLIGTFKLSTPTFSEKYSPESKKSIPKQAKRGN